VMGFDALNPSCAGSFELPRVRVQPRGSLPDKHAAAHRRPWASVFTAQMKLACSCASQNSGGMGAMLF
jgi:hypothetical protein